MKSPSRPFAPEFADCPTHGRYPLNMLYENGYERRFMPLCPVCFKQDNVARLLAGSNVPKRFAGCDFGNYETSTDAQRNVLQRCEEYARDFGRNRDAGVCLLLCGRAGTGKNHLATAITRRVVADGFTALFVTASQYLDVYWSQSFGQRQGWLQEMATVDLLVLDDVGRSSNSKGAQDAFFQLIDARYGAQAPMLLISNLNREGLIEVLGEAAYDRLRQGGATRLTLNWDSYRGKRGNV